VNTGQRFVWPSPKWHSHGRRSHRLDSAPAHQITSSVLDIPRAAFISSTPLDNKRSCPKSPSPFPSANSSWKRSPRQRLPLDHRAAIPTCGIDLSPDPLCGYQAVELNHDERRLLASISRSVSAKDLIAARRHPERRRRAPFTLCSFRVCSQLARSSTAESRTEKNR